MRKWLIKQKWFWIKSKSIFRNDEFIIYRHLIIDYRRSFLINYDEGLNYVIKEFLEDETTKQF